MNDAQPDERSSLQWILGLCADGAAIYGDDPAAIERHVWAQIERLPEAERASMLKGLRDKLDAQQSRHSSPLN